MCLAPQRRAIFPPFLDLWTSKSGPYPSVFWHFDFEMCFSPQQRAIFPHRNFKKWSAHDSFLAFWLENVLLATAACNFFTPQLQKVVRPWQFFSILTSKFASRFQHLNFKKWSETVRFLRAEKLHYTVTLLWTFQTRSQRWKNSSGHGMRFFMKSCTKKILMCSHLVSKLVNLQKWCKTQVFLTFWLVNVLGATAACHFSTISRPMNVQK